MTAPVALEAIWMKVWLLWSRRSAARIVATVSRGISTVTVTLTLDAIFDDCCSEAEGKD